MKTEGYIQYLDMLNQWLIIKQEGKSIVPYLMQKGYHSVAVYGMNVYGRHVIRELRETNIKIACGIDQKQMKPFEGVTIIKPEGELPIVDVIINTVIYDHTQIKNNLAQITDCPVVSLEDVIYESYGCSD